MKKSLVLVLALSSVSQALDPAVFTFGPDPSGYKLEWDGEAGVSSFIQYSTTLQAGSWSYFPVIKSGVGSYSFGFSTTEDKLFVRIVSTDVPTTDAEAHDFDGDGLGSLAEITSSPQTDPFKLDTDGNGVDDGGLADRDGDGIPTAYEIANGLDPLVANNATDFANYLASLTTTSSSLEVFTHLK